MLRGSTYKKSLNIVNFEVRLVLDAMQKNWPVFLQTLGHLRIVLRGKVISIFEFLPALAAVL